MSKEAPRGSPQAFAPLPKTAKTRPTHIFGNIAAPCEFLLLIFHKNGLTKTLWREILNSMKNQLKITPPRQYKEQVVICM